MKLITFAVPCYNSAAYMENCVQSLLPGGDRVEIILIDDGSKDETPAICDRLAAEHPEIIRVIHQPNGGHGEGVNQGLRHASGMYYKVVDSDDWLNAEDLNPVLDRLEELSKGPDPLDLMVCNYVYEHSVDNTSHSINYHGVFPTEKVFGWEECGKFRTGQYLLMHSVIYRTALLRETGIELPKHTFYVDNIFVYYPLPAVKSIYYMDVDLYRYFIGREDQSVSEQIMVKRVDQQILVTRLMFGYYNLKELKKEGKIRHFGISFHDKAEVLDMILTEHPEIEIVQIQFNYVDYEDASVESRKVYEVCEKHGKPVIVMEPVKGGSLVNLPDEADKILRELNGGSNASYALRFAASFPNMAMVLSGMSNMEQMQDNLSAMADFHPLNDQEMEAVRKVCDIFHSLNLIPCTSCRYCIEESECPKGIRIPDLFAALNAHEAFHNWNTAYYYNSVITGSGHGKASECIKCGKCENVCPQHLQIRELLKDVARTFE